jgi:predicted SnoaL-like aldol condensation-catalyzing enzyme
MKGVNTVNEKLRKFALDYFDVWNAQDLTGLADLLADDVDLTDWEVSAHGKTSVVNANQKIFQTVPEIRAEIVKVVADDMVAFAELKVFISPDEFIEVVDILTFSSEFKINSIHAYKCRAGAN